MDSNNISGIMRDDSILSFIYKCCGMPVCVGHSTLCRPVTTQTSTNKSLFIESEILVKPKIPGQQFGESGIAEDQQVKDGDMSGTFQIDEGTLAAYEITNEEMALVLISPYFFECPDPENDECLKCDEPSWAILHLWYEPEDIGPGYLCKSHFLQDYLANWRRNL